MPLAEQQIEAVPAKVGHIRREFAGGVVQAPAHEDPSHVRPPFAVTGRMRIAGAVRELMVHAMHADPEDRPAFQRQRSAYRKEILNPLRSFVAAMRQQPMVAHADSEAAGEPPKEGRNPKRLPGKVKECNYRTDMKSQHE